MPALSSASFIVGLASAAGVITTEVPMSQAILRFIRGSDELNLLDNARYHAYQFIIGTENQVDTIDLYLLGSSQDVLASNLSDLFRYVNLADDYWLSDYNDTPVMLYFRAASTSQPQYGLVKKIKIEELPNLLGASDFERGVILDGGNVTSGINIQIEVSREGDWASHQVGNSTSLQLSNNESNFGIAAANSANGVPVVNAGRLSLISAMFRFDQSAGTYTNLLTQGLPYNLFPSPAGVGDILYIGLSTSTTPTRAQQLVFDLDTAMAATSYTVIWEYWSTEGTPAWYAYSEIADFTSDPVGTGSGTSFSRTGRSMISLTRGQAIQPSRMLGLTTVNSVSAYWIRARISALSGFSSSPRQSGQHPFVTRRNWVNLPAGQSPRGDKDNEIDLVFTNLADSRGRLSTYDSRANYIQRLIVGSRKVSRGSSFASNLSPHNLGYNPAGVTVTYGDNVTSSNDAALFIPALASFDIEDEIIFTFDSTLASQYFGKFRAYLALQFSSLPEGHWEVNVKVQTGVGSGFIGNPVNFSQAGDPGGVGIMSLIDLGLVDIPSSRAIHRQDETIDSLRIVLQMGLVATVYTISSVTIYTLYLIPADETIIDATDFMNHFDYRGDGQGSDVRLGGRVVIDNHLPKWGTRAAVYDLGSNNIKNHFEVIGLPEIDISEAARLHFLLAQTNDTGPNPHWRTKLMMGGLVTAATRGRYSGLRGNL